MKINNIQSTNQTTFQKVRLLNGGSRYIKSLPTTEQNAIWNSALEMSSFKHTDILVSGNGLALKLKNALSGYYPEGIPLRGNFKPSKAIIDTEKEVTILFDASNDNAYNLPLMFSDKLDAAELREQLPKMSFVDRVITVAKHFEEQLGK